jgi:thymidine phosphorylase
VTLVLCGEMLRLGGLAPDAEHGEQRAAEALASGAALERFLQMVAIQGGRLDLERPDYGLQVAPTAARVEAPRPAWLAGVDGYEVGMAVVMLHGGRERKEDDIDPRVGLRWLARIGERLDAGQPVAEVLAPAGSDVGPVVRRLQGALAWSDAPVQAQPVVLGRRSA